MSRKKIEKIQREYSEIDKKCSDLLNVIFSKEIIIPGSYSETYIRCGTKTCHCQKKKGHYATRISIWEKGKLKTKIVNISDREHVKKGNDLYKKNKKALREIIKLQAVEKEFLKLVIDLRIKKYK